MANTAVLQTEQSTPENEGWELFEVGSYDEVIRLSELYPSSAFLQHLAAISRIENGEALKMDSPRGMSLLSPMLEAYISYSENRIYEACNQLEIYFRNKNVLLSYPFVLLSYKVFRKSEKKEQALVLIHTYKKKYLDLSFLKEEAILLYELKRYQELVQLYLAYPNQLNDPDLHRLIGLAMLLLGRTGDAMKLLERIPGRLNLPSFEEKRREYNAIYKKIGHYETRRESLSLREMEDMGFAYLFHSEYKKAESVFIELINRLKQ